MTFDYESRVSDKSPGSRIVTGLHYLVKWTTAVIVSLVPSQ